MPTAITAGMCRLSSLPVAAFWMMSWRDVSASHEGACAPGSRTQSGSPRRCPSGRRLRCQPGALWTGAQTMLPIISSLAPPAGYLVWSTVFAFLCRRLSRMLANGSLPGQRWRAEEEARTRPSQSRCRVSSIDVWSGARREEGQRERRGGSIQLQRGQDKVGADARIDRDLDLQRSAPARSGQRAFMRLSSASCRASDS